MLFSRFMPPLFGAEQLVLYACYTPLSTIFLCFFNVFFGIFLTQNRCSNTKQKLFFMNKNASKYYVITIKRSAAATQIQAFRLIPHGIGSCSLLYDLLSVLYPGDIRQISVSLVEIKSVSDYILILNFKSYVISFDLHLAPGRLVKDGAYL